MGVEKERDEAKEKAQVAQLATVIEGDTKAKAEGDLTRVQDALAVAEEAKEVVKEDKRKTKAEAIHLEVERTSLLLEIGATKDEVSSLHS